MKRIHWLCFALFGALLCCFQGVVAEIYHPILPGKARVISIEGLILRAAPGKSENRITTLPFGSQVEVLELANPKMDSLPAISGGDLPMVGEDPIWIRRVGYWAKVKWNGKIGYALDIFLAEEDFLGNQGENQQSLRSEINNSFLLYEVGTECTANVPGSSRYHWSGVYVRKGVVEVKPVSLRQHMTRIDAVVEGQLFLHTFSDDNQGLKFIIGTLDPFGETRKSTLIYNLEMKYETDRTETQWAEFLAAKGISYKAIQDDLGNESGNAINIRDGNGREQVLDWCGLDLLPYPCLRLVADLDGDGKPDYIVTYVEGRSRTVLYLSTKPHREKMMDPVAVWFSSYCC